MLGQLTVALLSLAFQLYAVRTGSMEPDFGSRDLVLVHNGEWQQGQPITFTHDGEVITHRCVSDGTLVTKGDASKTPDPWVVQPRDTIGDVATPPHLGYWLVYLKSITGLASDICALVGTLRAARLRRPALCPWSEPPVPRARPLSAGHAQSVRPLRVYVNRAAYRGQGRSLIDGAVYQPTCV